MFNERIIAENIKKYRRAKGYSQGELAALLSVSPQSVSKWECGLSTPDIANLFLLSKILDVSLDVLFDNTKERRRVLIGIDGGGSKTECVMFTEDGLILERLLLSACNPNAIGIDAAAEVLRRGIVELLAVHSGVCGIYIGASGFLLGDNAKAIKGILKKSFPHIRIGCSTDILNVIAAAGIKERCIAVIAGTGSVVYRKDGDTLTRFTGWGYLFSRGGSGYDIGRDAICAALGEREGLSAPTELTSLIETKLGASVADSIHELYKREQSYIASFAPLVFAAEARGDKIAAEILKKNARALADVILHAAAQGKAGEGIVLSGGLLTENNTFRELLCSMLPPTHKVIFPTYPQVYGACLLAAEMCGIGASGLSENFLKQYERGK